MRGVKEEHVTSRLGGEQREARIWNNDNREGNIGRMRVWNNG